jgi:hypothetical protein
VVPEITPNEARLEVTVMPNTELVLALPHALLDLTVMFPLAALHE